jgi:hypothetical protein
MKLALLVGPTEQVSTPSPVEGNRSKFPKRYLVVRKPDNGQIKIPRYSIKTISEKFEKLKSARGKG